jgi:hypothetical protein
MRWQLLKLTRWLLLGSLALATMCFGPKNLFSFRSSNNSDNPNVFKGLPKFYFCSRRQANMKENLESFTFKRVVKLTNDENSDTLDICSFIILWM